MSEGVQTVLVSGVVSLVVAVLGFYGIRFTARQSTQAKRSEIEAGAYTRAKDILEAAATRQDKEIARLGAQAIEQEERHRRQIAELREERREHDGLLNSRLDEMESQRLSDKQRIEALENRNNALGSYIRALIRLLRDNEISPPPAPPGMIFD